MNKRLSLLLILTFLSVQTFSLLHMESHGFQKHTHKGQTCDIYLSFDKNKISDTPVINLAVSTSFTLAVLTPFSPVMLSNKHYNSSHQRAPPVIFLS